jgi:hypothetical protein
MNDILKHWDFIEPDYYLDILDCCEELPKEWINIFYIARHLFSKNSSFPIKDHLAPILERKEIFPEQKIKKETNNDFSLLKLNKAELLDIGRITSIDQISYILPREFIIYPEDLFYKKLINKELCKKKFDGTEGLSVYELVYGKEKKLNRKQKVYILFDNSSSMNGEKLNKLFAAKAICLEYLRKVKEESPQIYFRFFNQDMGPLLKINKSREIKDLIRYIITLNTYDCYETKIGDAILTAIADIRSDPALIQAEIIMITDGLGEIPSDIKEQLEKIKFHMILISGLNIDKFLKLYPDKKIWEQELYKLYNKLNINKEEALDQVGHLVGTNDMSYFWEIFLKLPQIFNLQEVADFFIKIPSFIGEKFEFSNTYELDLIRDLRMSLAKKLDDGLSKQEKYEIFQRIKFLIKYLQVILHKEPSKKLKKEIKKEINCFQMLLKGFKEDEWFITTLDISISTSLKKQKKENKKGGKYTFRETNKPFVVVFFLALINWILAIPISLEKVFRLIISNAGICISNMYRKQRLKRRFNHINSKILQIITQ